MNKMNELCEMELTGRYEEKLSALKAEISEADEYIRQDNSDLTEFENRYERLDIPYRVKRFLDDYIACIRLLIPVEIPSLIRNHGIPGG